MSLQYSTDFGFSFSFSPPASILCRRGFKIINVTIKFNAALLTIIVLSILFLIFGMARSCNNTNHALSENKKLTELSNRLLTDSAQAAIQIQEYKEQAEAQDGQIALKDNQLQAKGDSLDAANARVLLLINKHKPIQPSPDTSITVVPNEYVNDCEGCFVALANGREVSMSYKRTADSLRTVFFNKKRTDSIQISRLTLRATNLTGTLRDAISAAAAEREKSRPRGKALLSIGTLFIDANMPNAIGGGGGYQDKYNRIFAAKYYASKYGSVKQVDIFIPLSFKRRR